MKLTFMPLCVILSVLLIFAGCVPSEEDSDPANASYVNNPYTNGEDLSGTTVNIFGAFVDVDESRFEDSMLLFEEATGIDIVYEGSGDFESLILVRVEGGNPPDLAAFPQPGLLNDFVKSGAIIDLNDWFDTSYLSQQYSQSWLDMATMEGIMAGIWHRANIKSLVWYPIPEFYDAGYEIPETWDELIALSDQMVADGGTPWSIGIESSGATGWVATDWIEDIMLRTAPLEAYDAWTRGELPFDSPEVRRAVSYLDQIWSNPDYVLGGKEGILLTPFGDAPRPLTDNPPAAWLHRQASFIPAFFPEGTVVGEEIDFFYFPPIDPEFGKPMLGAGDIYGIFNDRPEVRAVARYLTTGLSTKAWVEAGGFISPHSDASIDWYLNPTDRKFAELLNAADTFRFDGSDLMPGAVGADSFWTGMVDYVNGASIDEVLPQIDASWPN